MRQIMQILGDLLRIASCYVNIIHVTWKEAKESCYDVFYAICVNNWWPAALFYRNVTIVKYLPGKWDNG